jgi:putative hydrolase of the HAD superfamily
MMNESYIIVHPKKVKTITAKPRGVLFDYGHTLVYYPQIAKTHLVAARNVQRVLQDLGVSVNASRIQTVVGSFIHRTDNVVMSIEEEFMEILYNLGVKSYSQDDLQEIIQAHWRPYIQNVRARRGAKKLLEYLKRWGFKLGIVANIWSGGMNPVLERLGLERFFDTTVASIDVGFKKPDPKIFHLALEHLKLSPKEVIMVGDNPRTDIQGAHNLGMRTVRLMRGPNRKKPDLVAPDFKIGNLSALASIMQARTFSKV